MMSLEERLRLEIDAEPWAPEGAARSDKKNYSERLSHRIGQVVADKLRLLGIDSIKAPGRGTRDKQFMGGYGTKGVDVYMSDEKHGLLLTSGVKGLLFDPRKNLKNRYRDMVMEPLELHKRFPYAVCGHLFFLAKTESSYESKKFKTVLGEAVALLSAITGRERPDEVPELYETMGIMLFDPGRPDSLELAPKGIPEHLQAHGYCERLISIFHKRNPFF